MNRSIIEAARAAYEAGEIPAIDNIPCVCKAPRVEHLGKTHAGGNPATGCTRYREEQLAGIVARAHAAKDHGFRETMEAYEAHERGKAQKKRAGEVSVRPSDLRSCRRAIWYRETPPEGYEPLPTEKRQAWMGTLIHEAFEQRRAQLYPWRMFESTLHVPGSTRPYRLDEYDPITCELTEIKTAGDWKWDQVGQAGPDEKWLDQTMLYALLLIAMGYPVKRVKILVLQREGGLSEVFDMPYDEFRAQAALRWIADVATEIELGVEQPRDEPGPTTSKMCSQLCPARAHCWNMAEAEALGRSPENITILGLSPADEEVEARISDLVALAESRRAIKAQEDQLKALLDGIELREYGEFYPKPGGSSSKDWTGWAAMVKAEWDKPEWDRLTSLPDPSERKTRYWTWSRIRKSERDKRAKAKAEAIAASAAELDSSSAASPPATLHVVAERTDQAERPALPAAEAS